MSNSSNSELNKYFLNSQKQKDLFRKCKKDYGLTIGDITPSGKRKSKPYTLKDIQTACNKKKNETKKNKTKKNETKKSETKKSKSSNSSNSSNSKKEIKGYKITLDIIDAYEKKTKINSNESYPYINMDNGKLKIWCENNLVKELRYSGAIICNVSYNIKNDNTLSIICYVNDSDINEAYTTLDSIRNIDDILDRDENGNTEVTFKLKNTQIKPYYKEINC